MNGEKGFRGVFTSDMLPKKMRKFESGIINLDLSTGPGTHWVAYYNDPHNNFVEYFDSFGDYKYNNIPLKDVIIPANIFRYLRSSNKEVRYNSSFLQKPTSDRCGYFSMAYIKKRNRGHLPWDILYSLTQEPSDHNEKKVLL